MKRCKYIYVALASLMWLACGLPTLAQNVLSMDAEKEFALGETLSIPVSLDNADEVVALQMTLSVSGVSFDSNGITLNEERMDGHESSFKSVYDYASGSNKYNLVIFTSNNNAIKGNSGKLFSINLRAVSYFNAETDYAVSVKDIVMTDKTGKNISSTGQLSCKLSHQAEGPDLYACNFKFDKEFYKLGETVTLTYDVKNVGKADSEGGVYESMELNGTQSYCPLKNGLDESYNVKAGETVQRTATWTIPNEKEYMGKYHFSYGHFYGKNEDSRYESASYANLYFYVGNVLSTEGYSMSFPDETLKQECSITLNREGDVSKAADIAISISADRLHIAKTAHFNTGETSVQVPFRLKNNNIMDETDEVIVTFAAEGYVSCEYVIRIQDDDIRDYVDLKIDSFSFDDSKEYKPGDEFTVKTTIQNKGTMDLQTGWTEKIYVVDEYNYSDLVSTTPQSQTLAKGAYSPVITTTFKLPECPAYGGNMRVRVEVSSLDNDELTQNNSDNSLQSTGTFALKRVITITKPDQGPYYEKPGKQPIQLTIKRSGYRGTSPAITASSTNGRLVIEQETLPIMEETEVTAYVVDNRKIEENSNETLTVNVEGYDPVELDFVIHNDDIRMTEEHQLLKKFVESEGLNTENWENKWEFADDGIISTHLDGVTFNVDNHVSSIVLKGRNLSGTLPRYLFDLPYLCQIDLSENEFSGKIEDVLGDDPAASQELEYVDIYSNDFTGNLGKFAAKLPSTLMHLHAQDNMLDEINPQLSEKGENFDCNISDQRLNLVYKNMRITDLNKEFLSSNMPQIVWYDARLNFIDNNWFASYMQSSSEEEFVEGKDIKMNYTWDFYNNKEQLYFNLSSDYKQHRYFGKSGDYLYWHLNNVTWAKLQLVFDQGDCNFDDEVDASDLQATVLEAFDEYCTKRNPKPYNFTAGNTFEDDVINVQDVICTVNMLLDNMSGNASAAAKPRTGELNGNEGVEARVYIADGKVVLKSDKKVAAFTIETRGNINWTADALGMTQTTSTNGIVGYSLSGNSLPEGITVLGTCGDDAYILDASLSDEQATTLKSVIGDGETTGIGSTFINGFDDQNVYDMNGVRQQNVGNGVYILEKDGKVNKVSINKRK